MRDPNRIDPAVEALRAAWKANPDLRLGQLVCNASRATTGNVDPFNTEDDQTVAGLRRQYAVGSLRREGTE